RYSNRYRSGFQSRRTRLLANPSLISPFDPRFSPFNLKKGNVVGSLCNTRKCGAVFPIRRRRRQSSPVRNIQFSKSRPEEAYGPLLPESPLSYNEHASRRGASFVTYMKIN